MIRVALISDIHANLPALTAVLADIDQRDIRTIYHLGDLTGYAPWPNEVVATLTERGIVGIAGNYDSCRNRLQALRLSRGNGARRGAFAHLLRVDALAPHRRDEGVSGEPSVSH